MYTNEATHTIESSTQTRTTTRHHNSHSYVILRHTASSLTSLRLDHQFGPTLTYLSTTRGPDDMAGVTASVKGETVAVKGEHDVPGMPSTAWTLKTPPHNTGIWSNRRMSLL